VPVRYVDALPDGADLVIVGAGIVGAATAFHAARAGLSPVVIEARRAPATLTTPASTGAFRLQFDNREELEVVQESVEFLERFEEETRQAEFLPHLRRNGYLFATTSVERADQQRALVGQQRQWGQDDIELIDGDEARSRFRYLAPEVIQARFRADDGFLDPVAVTKGFLVGAACPVMRGCEVTGVLGEERIEGVDTAWGALAADRVVLAAGPFTAALAAGAGVELPVVAIARQKLVFSVLPEIPADAPMTIDDDTGAHWRPFLEGAAALLTDPATPASEPAWEVPPQPEHARAVLDPDSPRSVARITPLWRRVWERGDRWEAHTGQYVQTPDHRPLLGPAGPEGLFINNGYSGHGIMASPAGSRHLVDVMTGRIAEADNPFAVNRVFAERERDLL
jgi:sarcosine oxidase subunit beta